MTSTRCLKSLGVFALALSATFCAGTQSFRQAREEELLQHWDIAVLKYSRALALEPGNTSYKIALGRAKMKAAQFHFERGKIYRNSGQPELAVVELEQTVILDPTNQYAETELKKARDEAQKLAAERNGPTKLEDLERKTRGARAHAPILEPTSDKPINLNFPQPKPIKQIYLALASAAGINVIFDPQLKDDNVSIVLTNIEFQKALETLMRQENHFYKVIDEHTILIAADTPANRKTYEDLVLRTFYLSNGDITDVSNALRNLLQTTRIYPNKAENSITIRDTADKVAIAERIIEENDKQLGEVVIDVELLQVNSQKMQEIGAVLSSYSPTASVVASAGTTDLGGALSGGALTFDQLLQITKRSFGFTIPSATLNFIKSNTDSELLAKPQLRISEGQKAQLVIGDKVPIPTTTFQSQVAGTGTTIATPITSFQYQDVGIKIEVEPRVHHNKEVTLKLALEVSQLGLPVTYAGQSQPTISTRTISSNIRLKDGETNFLAGLYRKDKSRASTDIPFLADLPVIGRLFSDKNVSNTTTDLVLTLTPHIIRIPDITEEDLTPLYVGTDQNISFAGTPRIETPGIAGPFDFQRGVPPNVPQPPRPTPGAINYAPAGPPSDIFRSPLNQVPPQPVPTPPPQPFGAAISTPVDDPTAVAAAASNPWPAAVLVASATPTLSYDFDPASLVVPAGQQRSILVRATGQGTLSNTSIAVHFDPSVVAAVAARPILGDDGVADAHVEPGRAVVAFASPMAISGTQAVAEITLVGVKPGQSILSFEQPANGSAAVVQVK